MVFAAIKKYCGQLTTAIGSSTGEAACYIRCAHNPSNIIIIPQSHVQRFFKGFHTLLNNPGLPNPSFLVVTLTDQADDDGDIYVFLVTTLHPDPIEDSWQE